MLTDTGAERNGKMSNVDYSKLASTAASHAQKHEDKKHNAIVQIVNALGRRYDHNPSDPVFEIIDVLLGIEPGGDDKVKELLGFTTINTSDNGNTDLAALMPAPTPKFLPLFNEDGSPTGTGLPVDKAIADGYTAKLDPVTNEVVAYIVPSTAPAPTHTTPLDRVVEVRDRKGDRKRDITVKDGNDDKSLEAVIGADGTVSHFVAKSRLIPRK